MTLRNQPLVIYILEKVHHMYVNIFYSNLCGIRYSLEYAII